MLKIVCPWCRQHSLFDNENVTPLVELGHDCWSVNCRFCTRDLFTCDRSCQKRKEKINSSVQWCVKSMKGLVGHLKRSHNLVTLEETLLSGSDTENVNTDFTDIYKDPNKPPISEGIQNHSSFTIGTSLHQFSGQIVGRNLTVALRQLVCQAACNGCLGDSTETTVTKESIITFLSLAKVAWHNSSDDAIANLGLFLSFIGPLAKIPKDWLPIPSSAATLKESMTSTRGKYSLRNVLPMPSSQSLDNGNHTYTSFIELGGYCIMTGIQKPGAIIKKRHQLIMTWRKVQKCLETISSMISNNTPNPILCLPMFWFDGFEPNRTMTNRQSAWVGTVTFFLYDIRQQELYHFDSFLLTSGSNNTANPISWDDDTEDVPEGKQSKGEHHSVFGAMHEDFKLLVKEGKPVSFHFPSRHHNSQMSTVYFCPLGFLMDNPERRADFGLRGGNSKNHSTFGYSIRFDLLQKSFASCFGCQNRIISYLRAGVYDESFSHNHECNNCYSFSLKRLVTVGHYREPIAVFPEVSHLLNQSLVPGIHLNTRPGRLSSQLLLEAWEFAIRVYGKDWSKSDVSSYLGLVLCVNKATLSAFEKQMEIYLVWEEYMMDPLSFDEEEILIFEQNVSLNPNHYEKPRPPPLWNFCDLDFAFEVPMHLKMNTLKFNTALTLSWCRTGRKGKKYLDSLADPLGKAKSVRASQFPVIIPKTAKFGGYVGENWNTFCMLAPWSLKFVDSFQFTRPSVYHVPVGLVSSWNRKECRDWLDRYGVEFPDESTLKVLRIKVNNAIENGMNLKEVQPGSSAEIREMHMVLTNFCAALMNTYTGGTLAKHLTEALAARYLSHVNSVYTAVHPNEIKPVWVKTFSLMGCLRITEHFSDITYVKTIYEGADMGEGLIKPLRKLVGNSMHLKWSLLLHERFYREYAFNLVSNALVEHPEKLRVSDRFRVYEGVQSLNEILRVGDVFSFVCFSLEETSVFKYGFIIKQLGNWYCHELNLYSMASSDCSSYPHFRVAVGRLEVKLQDGALFGNIIHAGEGLALPNKEGGEIYYSFVFGDGSFLDSSCCRQVYNTAS